MKRGHGRRTVRTIDAPVARGGCFSSRAVSARGAGGAAPLSRRANGAIVNAVVGSGVRARIGQVGTGLAIHTTAGARRPFSGTAHGRGYVEFAIICRACNVTIFPTGCGGNGTQRRHSVCRRIGHCASNNGPLGKICLCLACKLCIAQYAIICFVGAISARPSERGDRAWGVGTRFA